MYKCDNCPRKVEGFEELTKDLGEVQGITQDVLNRLEIDLTSGDIPHVCDYYRMVENRYDLDNKTKFEIVFAIIYTVLVLLSGDEEEEEYDEEYEVGNYAC